MLMEVGTTGGKLTRQFVKPLVHGVVSAGSMSYAFGADKGFYVVGKRVPVPLFGLALGAVGSFLTETVDAWVLPYTIGKDAKVRKLESMVVAVGASAAYFAAVPKLLNGDTDSAEMSKLAMVGAVTELASSYLYTNVVAGPGSLFGGKY